MRAACSALGRLGPKGLRALTLIALAVVLWPTAVSAASLARPVFWQSRPDVAVQDGAIVIDGSPDPVVDPYGAQLKVSGDFHLSASLQASAPATAAGLVLQDDAGNSVELGLPDQAAGPLTLELERVGSTLVRRDSGHEVGRQPYPFQGTRLRIGTHIDPGVHLTIYALDVDGAVSLDRCAPERLLLGGAEVIDGPPALWWFSPDDGRLERIDTDGQRPYLVAISPDHRWVSYYQRSPGAPSDRFVVEAWAMNLATEERVRLVDPGTPFAWTADSSAVVLGERPNIMVTVPGAELRPTEGPLVQDNSLRSVNSPTGELRAMIASSQFGVEGIQLLDRSSGDVIMDVPTGRAAAQMAWAPDGSRLAYTTGLETASGPVWRLRMVDVAERSWTDVAATRDMELHTVVWAPQLPGCS